MSNFFETEWERPEFDSVPSLAENAVWRLPGCDDKVLRKTLQEVYRDFCKRSAALRTWRKVEIPLGDRDCCGMRDFDPFAVGFAVSPVLSGEIDCVTQVLWDGMLTPIRGWRVGGNPPMLLIPHLSAHDFFVASGRPAVQEKPNVGVVDVTSPSPDTAVRTCPPALLVEAVEIPHIGEERAPKAFLRRYGDAIVDGALARLFSISNRSWSDPEQARQHGVAYSNALSEARLRSMNGGPTANVSQNFALDMRSMV